MQLPFPTALTLPFAVTVATAGLEDSNPAFRCFVCFPGVQVIFVLIYAVFPFCRVSFFLLLIASFFGLPNLPPFVAACTAFDLASTV